MAYMRPDFEASFDPPSWLDFGDDSEQFAPNVSPFVDALKKRMRRSPNIKGGMETGVSGKTMPDMGIGKAMGGGLTGGGGPKSL